MRMAFPEGYDKYVSFIETEKHPFKHLVVHVSSTPKEPLEKLRDHDRTYFEHTGQHAIEFLED